MFQLSINTLYGNGTVENVFVCRKSLQMLPSLAGWLGIQHAAGFSLVSVFGRRIYESHAQTHVRGYLSLVLPLKTKETVLRGKQRSDNTTFIIQEDFYDGWTCEIYNVPDKHCAKYTDTSETLMLCCLKLHVLSQKCQIFTFLFCVYSRKTGQYTLQQNPDILQEDKYEPSLTTNSAKPSSTDESVGLSSSSAGSSRSQPFSSPRHSPNARTRHQPKCQRSHSQVGSEVLDENCIVSINFFFSCFKMCGCLSNRHRLVFTSKF